MCMCGYRRRLDAAGAERMLDDGLMALRPFRLAGLAAAAAGAAKKKRCMASFPIMALAGGYVAAIPICARRSRRGAHIDVLMAVLGWTARNA